MLDSEDRLMPRSDTKSRKTEDPKQQRSLIIASYDDTNTLDQSHINKKKKSTILNNSFADNILLGAS